ncbi:MAG TPA: prolyl oligopeptidase family serine peptidase, partial [Hyphomicrobiales bacterium]|nr:prolyl oligopeptidase family serine peptidase [Hyphomicrobiales bacterium]
FVNDADQDVYRGGIERSSPASAITRLTNLPATRFADFTSDARRSRLIGVGETHDEAEAKLPKNALWQIPTGDPEQEAKALFCEHDFYASPRVSPDGNHAAFLAWNLPHMPWDAAQLFVAGIGRDGALDRPVRIAGGEGSACFQPEWGEDGALYFVWDRDGLGNLFRWREDDGIGQITRLDADLSMPLWNFHAASYAILPGNRAYLSFVRVGEAGSAILDLISGALQPNENGLTTILTLAAGEGGAALSGLSDREPLHLSIDSVSGNRRVVRQSSAAAIEEGYVSPPRRIEIPGKSGPVYGLLHEPRNPAAAGPSGRPPPLIVNLHGGPTAAAGRGLKPRILFFTSRGFSWLDLDYSGSTGYGRAYRDRLKGKWGVADVEDTISAAEFAASEGLANPRAIFATGGSAGGYTVLMAIAASAVFRGAASYYGICDLIALQKTTHKFEHGYQSALLGGTLEENEELYRQRSAIAHVERIKTPLILFQGAEDKVVPRSQSMAIAEALRERGVAVEYYEFEGEGHGFRRAETIIACLERELAFYRSLL